MDGQLRTELEHLRRRDVEEKPFHSVEHAVSLLHAHETWFAGHRAESDAADLTSDDYRDGAD